VCDGFSGGHDQVVIGDLAFEQCRENVNRTSGLPAQFPQLFQTGLVFINECVKTGFYTTERFAVRRQDQHIIGQPGFKVM